MAPHPLQVTEAVFSSPLTARKRNRGPLLALFQKEKMETSELRWLTVGKFAVRQAVPNPKNCETITDRLLGESLAPGASDTPFNP
jgi:hypothetical protein